MSAMDRQRAADVLGVNLDDDVDVIMSAYRRSTFNTHPDIPGGSQEKFVEVSTAKEVLLAADAETDVDEAEESSVSASAVMAQPVQRVMWLALAKGSAAAVAVVILVIIVAPTAPTAGPIIIVAVGYAAVKAWRAVGSPQPWSLLLKVGNRSSALAPTKSSRLGTRSRSAASEDWSKPPREWG